MAVTERVPHERGTVLLLFPAAVLVLMVLGAIAVDLGMVGGARRDLIRVVGAAADDAALRIDIDRLRAEGLAVIDLDAARRQVVSDLALATLPGDAVGLPVVEMGDEPATIVVEVTRRIPHVFARAVPGLPDSELITVRLTGRIHDPARE